MPKHNPFENNFRSWTKAEYFAHNKNAMVEKNLHAELNTMTKQRYVHNVHTKQALRNVHDIFSPLKQTTGHYKHEKKTSSKYLPKRVTFTEEQKEEDDEQKEQKEEGDLLEQAHNDSTHVSKPLEITDNVTVRTVSANLNHDPHTIGTKTEEVESSTNISASVHVVKEGGQRKWKHTNDSSDNAKQYQQINTYKQNVNKLDIQVSKSKPERQNTKRKDIRGSADNVPSSQIDRTYNYNHSQRPKTGSGYTRILTKRCQSAPSSLKARQSQLQASTDDTENTTLTEDQIMKINQFYMNKNKHVTGGLKSAPPGERYRRTFGRPLHGGRNATEQDQLSLYQLQQEDSLRSNASRLNASRNSTRQPVCTSPTQKDLEEESKDSFPEKESLWKKVTLSKLRVFMKRSNRALSAPSPRTGVGDDSELDTDDDDLTRGRTLTQMPRIFEVYLAAKNRFKEKADEVRKGRRKSDTSLKSLGTESFLTSSFADSSSDDDETTEGASVSFKDPLEEYLWKAPDEDTDLNKDHDHANSKSKLKKKKKKKKKGKEKKRIVTPEIEEDDLHSTDFDPVIPDHTMKESHTEKVSSINVYLPKQEDSAVSFFSDKSEDIQAPYISAPTFSLSFNTVPRNSDGSIVRDKPIPRVQTAPIHKALAWTRTDTTAYQNLPGHWNYSSDAIPLAQYIRAVESGLSIESFIEPVSELKVPISLGAIRRQREEMVEKQEATKRVSTDKERARMKEIQNRINQFLLSLPRVERDFVI